MKGLYHYGPNFYYVSGGVNSLNPVTDNWEKHVLCTSIETGEKHTRHITDFEENFKKIDGFKNLILRGDKKLSEEELIKLEENKINELN